MHPADLATSLRRAPRGKEVEAVTLLHYMCLGERRRPGAGLEGGQKIDVDKACRGFFSGAHWLGRHAKKHRNAVRNDAMQCRESCKTESHGILFCSRFVLEVGIPCVRNVLLVFRDGRGRRQGRRRNPRRFRNGMVHRDRHHSLLFALWSDDCSRRLRKKTRSARGSASIQEASKEKRTYLGVAIADDGSPRFSG